MTDMTDTDSIVLRPFERGDFVRLMSWIRSPEFLIQWAGPQFEYPLDESQLEAYFQDSQGEKPSRMIYKVVDTCDEVIGHIELNKIDLQNGSGTISRVLVDPHHQGKGVCARMLRQLLAVAFQQLRLHRVDLFVFDFNLNAIRCYERVGFVKEGLLRDVRKVGNTYWSGHFMSILSHEWDSRRNITR